MSSFVPNMGRIVNLMAQEYVYRAPIKEEVNFQILEKEGPPKTFYGTLIADPKRNLEISTSGQREWGYWNLYTEEILELDGNVYDSVGKKYKVMSQNNWVQFGYFQYLLTETYVN